MFQLHGPISFSKISLSKIFNKLKDIPKVLSGVISDTSDYCNNLWKGLGKKDTIFGIVFPVFVCSISIFFISYIPGWGTALNLITPKTLLFFGEESMKCFALATTLYTLALIAHRQLDGEEDTRISGAVTTVLTTMGIGVIHRLTQHMKMIATFAAYASGYASVGLAVQLIWILGAPIAMGALHYHFSAKDGDAKIVDTIFFTLSLMAAATAGWYTQSWKDLNPFSQSSKFTHYLTKLAPAVGNPSATLEQVAGQLFTRASILFLATRGLCPSLRKKKNNGL